MLGYTLKRNLLRLITINEKIAKTMEKGCPVNEESSRWEAETYKITEGINYSPRKWLQQTRKRLQQVKITRLTKGSPTKLVGVEDQKHE